MPKCCAEMLCRNAVPKCCAEMIEAAEIRRDNPHVPAAIQFDRLFDSHQFHDPAGHVPVLHVKVAVFVPIRTVGAAEYAFDPVFLLNIEVRPLFRIRVVPENGHDRIAFVEDREPSVQVRH